MKINIGCGNDIREGWINLDFLNKKADIIFDLNNLEKGDKINIGDELSDYIFCNHVLEDFINPIPLLDEMYRLCKPGGIIEIGVPFGTMTWNNINHKRPFFITTFYNYIERTQYQSNKNLEIISKEYITVYTNNKSYFIKKPLTVLMNLIGYKIIEKTLIKYLIPDGIFINIKYKKTCNSYNK